MKKPEKTRKYEADGRIFDTFKTLKNYVYFNTPIKMNKINNNKKNFLIMAATKFTAIYVNNERKIIEREIPGMNTYKIAENSL